MSAPEKLRGLIASLRSCSCIYGCKCEEAARALEVLLQPVKPNAVTDAIYAFDAAFRRRAGNCMPFALEAARAALIEEMMRDE